MAKKTAKKKAAKKTAKKTAKKVVKKVTKKVDTNPLQPELLEYEPTRCGAFLHLKAKLGNTISLPSRAIVKVSCGCKCNVPPPMMVLPADDLAERGLIVVSHTEDGELSVIVANVGREIIPIQDRQEFAKMRYVAALDLYRGE